MFMFLSVIVSTSLQSTVVDDISWQIEKLWSKCSTITTPTLVTMVIVGFLEAREDELAQLRGEKAVLEREVDRLSRENRNLRDEVAAVKAELVNQAAGMEQAE